MLIALDGTAAAAAAAEGGPPAAAAATAVLAGGGDAAAAAAAEGLGAPTAEVEVGGVPGAYLEMYIGAVQGSPIRVDDTTLPRPPSKRCTVFAFWATQRRTRPDG